MAVELTTARYGHGLLDCAMRALEEFAMYKRFQEFAVWFAMGRFQTKKPRDKAGREFRASTSAGGRALACARYRKVSGFFEAIWANHFQQKKIAYGVGYANSRRGRSPSTR